MYRLPWAQVFVRLVSSAALGGAKAATKSAIEIMKTRISTNTGKASKADPLLQNAIARAWAEIDEMETVLTRNFDAMREAEGLADRATFIVDPDNTIQHVSVNNLNVGRNPEEVLRILDGLQTDELCPCNRAVGGATL